MGMRVVLPDGRVKEMRSVFWDDGVVMIDQRLLPGEFRLFRAESVEDVAFAIKDMVVRGAPAIGAAAAYGLALAAVKGEDLEGAARTLGNTRPTAHDLFFALRVVRERIESGRDPISAAEEYAESVVEKSRLIGVHGEPLVEDGSRILTHCNAGALATLDWGTALAPIRMAHRKGKEIFVFVDETRPKLQGARLTAWELLNEGIPHAVIADNAAGFYMWRGEIGMVIVGADRIASNGDFANKIGTYEKAVVAKEHGIPFYVAAPISTFDFSLGSGREIPIEMRNEDEVHFFAGSRITPEGSRALNPAFDVTPAEYVTAYITEFGIFHRSELEKLKRMAH